MEILFTLFFISLFYWITRIDNRDIINEMKVAAAFEKLNAQWPNLNYMVDDATLDLYKNAEGEVVFPFVGSAASSGFDVMATESVLLKPGQRRAVGTGLFFQIPVGYEIQVRPRSGLALKHGIAVLNTPGTVDQDYRGEVKVVLYNADQNEYQIKRGERIAQLVLSKTTNSTFTRVDSLEETERNEGGFGSTGF